MFFSGKDLWIVLVFLIELLVLIFKVIGSLFFFCQILTENYISIISVVWYLFSPTANVLPQVLAIKCSCKGSVNFIAVCGKTFSHKDGIQVLQEFIAQCKILKTVSCFTTLTLLYLKWLIPWKKTGTHLKCGTN